MRIGLLTDVYRPGFSGVANHVLLLKEFLTQNGHQVFVFAFERKPGPQRDPTIIYSPGAVIAGNYPFGLRLCARAADLLNSMDILHIHQPFASGSAALHAARARRIPMVFTAHTRYDLYSQSYLPFVPTALSTFLISQYLRSFSQHMALVIAPSPSMAEKLRSWHVQTRLAVIPNGIDLHAFSSQPEERSPLRQRLRLPDAACTYIYVGRITDEKNILFLINSYRLVCKEQPGSLLLLVGGGPKISAVKTAVQDAGLSDRVVLSGQIPYEQVAEIMQAADIFVTASKTEVHPLTVIEALACGLPVVGLHAPGVAEIVVDGETGFLCPEDPTVFAERMLAVGYNAQLRAKMGLQAHQAASAYSAQRTAQRIFEQYQLILNGE